MRNGLESSVLCDSAGQSNPLLCSLCKSQENYSYSYNGGAPLLFDSFFCNKTKSNQLLTEENELPRELDKMLDWEVCNCLRKAVLLLKLEVNTKVEMLCI